MQVICFHNPDEDNGYLSNWYLSKFSVGDWDFTSAEKYLMFEKANLFDDIEIANKILETDDVKRIKMLGRQVLHFDNGLWNRKKLDILYNGLKAKFEQNPLLQKKLLETGDNILANCAIRDKIWGIGLKIDSKKSLDPYNWTGLNLLGKTLMKVRENFREDHSVKNLDIVLKDYLKIRMSIDAKIDIIGNVLWESDFHYDFYSRPFRVYFPELGIAFRETYLLEPVPTYEYDLTEDYTIYVKDTPDANDFVDRYYSFQDTVKAIADNFKISVKKLFDYRCVIKFDEE